MAAQSSQYGLESLWSRKNFYDENFPRNDELSLSVCVNASEGYETNNSALFPSTPSTCDLPPIMPRAWATLVNFHLCYF